MADSPDSHSSQPEPDLTRDPNERTWLIDGQEYREHDLKQIIIKTELHQTFQFGVFVKYFLYHLAFLLLSPLLAVPIIWVAEGFRTEALYNMKFIGCNRLVLFEILPPVLVLIGHIDIAIAVWSNKDKMPEE